MPTSSILKYFISLLLLAAPLCLKAQQSDSVQQKADGMQPSYRNQLRLGFDISKPVANAYFKNRSTYELSADYYYLPKDIYLVLEGGAGAADIQYPDLSYTSNSYFFRAGLDKGLLQRLTPGDWDVVFAGARYGLALVNRQEAHYVIADSVWGNSAGSIPASSRAAHWLELTAGIRVELLRGLFAGWNVRAKFFMNQNTFKELPPAYIAGYGAGDRSTAFDFNMYLSYAIRWHKQ